MGLDAQPLWEILVPCQWNTGRPVRTRHHKEWDRRVRAIAGGLTIHKPAKGQWVHEGALFEERMIPVRVRCSDDQINKIGQITIQHYKQLAVMFYLVSNYCVIMEAEKDVSA